MRTQSLDEYVDALVRQAAVQRAKERERARGEEERVERERAALVGFIRTRMRSASEGF